MTTQDVPVCGGAADLYRFFDQVFRALVMELLTLTGMPMTILSAYSRFLEELVACNMEGADLGRGESGDVASFWDARSP